MVSKTFSHKCEKQKDISHDRYSYELNIKLDFIVLKIVLTQMSQAEKYSI